MRHVTVTLRAPVLLPVQGKLTECDNRFLVIKTQTDEVAIPLTSVLQIVLMPRTRSEEHHLVAL